jgi:hypothetical protein
MVTLRTAAVALHNTLEADAHGLSSSQNAGVARVIDTGRADRCETADISCARRLVVAEHIDDEVRGVRRVERHAAVRPYRHRSEVGHVRTTTTYVQVGCGGSWDTGRKGGDEASGRGTGGRHVQNDRNSVRLDALLAQHMQRDDAVLTERRTGSVIASVEHALRRDRNKATGAVRCTRR